MACQIPHLLLTFISFFSFWLQDSCMCDVHSILFDICFVFWVSFFVFFVFLREMRRACVSTI